jgi:acyl-CoA dehydrogenase
MVYIEVHFRTVRENVMDFEMSDRVLELRARLEAFMQEHIYPRELEHGHWTEDHTNGWSHPVWFEDLKSKAKAAGIWNWFLPPEYEEFSPGLSNLEFAPLMEIMCRVPWSQEVFNCSAPDRGNMEVLARYGSPQQQDRWLKPLLDGSIRSAFSMTEPAVASSDASNLQTTIVRDGDEYVINGRKWFTSNAYNPACKLLVVMGKTNPEAPRHRQFSTILVPKDTPGVVLERPLRAFGSLHAPGGHAQVLYDNVRVPVDNLVLGEGRGFEIAQGRLGPGRFQYAMMFVGMAQRCLDLMCRRVEEREAFGEKLSAKTSIQHDIARSRCEIEQCRLLVLAAADRMDKHGPKAARDYISMVKIVAPQMCQTVADRALQAHGGMGVTQDTPISRIYLTARYCRIADGPDEVHMSQLGRRTIQDAL